jgi:hypothetical protein
MDLPNKANRNALILRPSTDLTTISAGDRIVSRMVGEALELARRQAIQAAKRTIKLGNFDLCEPDYRQIVRWATELGREPEDLVVELSEETWQFDEERSARFRIEGGSIKELAWHCDLFPIEVFEWEAGLEIEVLSMNAGGQDCFPNWSASQRLPSLRTLNVSGGAGRDFFGRGTLLDLDLSATPGLTALYLTNIQLKQLDLSPLPRLKKLECSDNWLTELDLSQVPGLTELDCSSNQLTELDLSPVQDLTKLWCHDNQITELHLPPAPELTVLWCYENPLTDLDLSPVPGLTELDCSSNQLTELDLSPVPGLKELSCTQNQLASLDLSPVPRLTVLRLSANNLTELDLSPVPGLKELWYSQNPLVELDLRPLDNPNIRLSNDYSVIRITN